MSNLFAEHCRTDPQLPAARCTESDAVMEANPRDETVAKCVQLFKLLADETRLRILFILHQTEEMNVLQLCHELHLRQPSISHHLALLRVAGLIAVRREGKHNYYRILSQRLQGLFETVANE